MEHLSASLELKAAPDDDGVFSGYASIFNVIDQGLDVVEPGAFAKSLSAPRKVRMLWQHDMTDPIGVWDEIREDDRGLYVKGRILTEVTRGKDALALLKAGAIDSMSIGYRTKQAEAEGNGSVRRLLEIELHEISLVTFPMLPEAQVTDVKAIHTIRDFEKALRDAGFSQTEAKAIAADGFKGLADRRDADTQWTDIAAKASLLDKICQLKGAMT